MACALCDYATVGCVHCSMATRQQQRTFTAGSSAQLGLTAQQTYAVASAAQAQSYSNQLNPQPLTADTLKQAILEGVATLIAHEWTIERGNLVFCGRCGDSGEDILGCDPKPEETVKERIESTIAVVMYNRGYSGRWHNQPMAIEARAKHAATRRVAYWKVSRTREQDLIGGWNKRVP